MSKNKKIININNSIDYDKLAEAIVKAQDSIDKEEIKHAIIEANQEIENNKPKFNNSRELLKFVIYPMLWVLTAIGALFAIGVIVYFIFSWNSFDFNDLSSFFNIIMGFVVFAFSSLFAVFCGLSAKEIENTEDTNFVLSMFSNIVAFVALIIAAIALVK